MKFFGAVFLITTTLVLLFKKELPPATDRQQQLEDTLTVKKTYKIVWEIIKLSSVKKLAIILLTSRVNLHECFFYSREILNNNTAILMC